MSVSRQRARAEGSSHEQGSKRLAKQVRRLLNVSLVLFYSSTCPLRCRGGLNGGGGLEGFGIWCLTDSPTKNRIPPPSAVADFGVLLPPAPSSSVFDLWTSARVSFLFSGSLICGSGRGTGVSPREDNPRRSVRSVTLALIPPGISSRGSHLGGRVARPAVVLPA